MVSMQLQEALQAFLLQLSADGRSPHTIGQYRRHVMTLIAWVDVAGAGTDIVSLVPELLARFFTDCWPRSWKDRSSLPSIL